METQNISASSPTKVKTLALFPGQGSQFVGMVKDLYDNFTVVKAIFEEASDAIHMNLGKLCFDGPEAELTLTENTQPALLTAAYASFQVAATQFEFKPDLVAGHSLGEYTALVAAGALPFATAISWVRERGRAMQVAVPVGQGTMAAILNMEDSSIEQLCKKATENAKMKRLQAISTADTKTIIDVEAVVEPANFNAPGQTVIAGSVDAIEEAIALVQAGTFGTGKAVPLTVSAPFHCKLMTKARLHMQDLFTKSAVKPKPLFFPYIPNRIARLTQEASLVSELLIEQVDHPVLWKQSMMAALESGVSMSIEFGPGKVLTGLMKRVVQQYDLAQKSAQGTNSTSAPTSGRSCKLMGLSDLQSLKSFEAALETKPKEKSGEI